MADSSVCLSRVDCLLVGAWDFVGPNPALAPRFEMVSQRFGLRKALLAEGNGREECYGFARCPVQLQAGRSYRLRVRLQAEGLDAVDHHVVHGVYGPSYSGGLFSLHSDGKDIVGKRSFPGPAEAMTAELRVYFRYSANGRVTWKEIVLEECEPIPVREVTFACRQGQMPAGASLDYWAEWLDCAGQRKPDVVLLPETFDGVGPLDAVPEGGPSAALLRAKARQWNMHTCGTIYEKRGDLVYNTAPLFDRSGGLVGKYDKLLPYEQELDQGVSPGRELRVFDTDFARVAVLTCFDSWFPETARKLARDGAEVLLLPNAGYFEDLMPARAADNGVWIAASSLYHSAGVWETTGARAGEMAPSQTRESPSAILSVETDYARGMLLVTVDLSKQYSPHWKGGPMLSAPGARGARVTSLLPLEMGR